MDVLWCPLLSGLHICFLKDVQIVLLIYLFFSVYFENPKTENAMCDMNKLVHVTH